MIRVTCSKCGKENVISHEAECEIKLEIARERGVERAIEDTEATLRAAGYIDGDVVFVVLERLRRIASGVGVATMPSLPARRA